MQTRSNVRFVINQVRFQPSQASAIFMLRRAASGLSNRRAVSDRNICRTGELEMPEREVVETITAFASLWDELFPAEQARIVRLLVERIDLSPDGMQVRLRADGLQTLVEELRSREAEAA